MKYLPGVGLLFAGVISLPLLSPNLTAVRVTRALLQNGSVRPDGGAGRMGSIVRSVSPPPYQDWRRELKAALFVAQMRRSGRNDEAEFSSALDRRGEAEFPLTRVPSIEGGELMRVGSVEALMLPGAFARASLLVFIPYTGRYRVAVRALNASPPPVLIAIELGNAQATLSYDRGNGSWESQSAVLELTAGMRLATLTFLNDYFDAQTGEDRNAVIQSLSIERDTFRAAPSAHVPAPSLRGRNGKSLRDVRAAS